LTPPRQRRQPGGPLGNRFHMLEHEDRDVTCPLVVMPEELMPFMG
jgi:hypothetical protein